MKKRNQTLRKQAFERDKFTCQKYKLVDKTKRKLEAHHINLLVFDGKDELANLITLCSDCHHYALDDKSQFQEYMKEECNGTMTLVLKGLKDFNKK